MLPTFHPELATARIKYILVDKGSQKGGRPVFGKCRRISGALEYLLELDFLVEVSGDIWNELSVEQRQSLVDHLLERCTGEEDENTGEMVWKLREPDVQEFATILRRRGAWTAELTEFVSVAKTLDVEGILEEIEGEEIVTTMSE
jgi:hypothetical protein